MGPFLIGKSLVLFHKNRNINISVATKKTKFSLQCARNIVIFTHMEGWAWPKGEGIAPGSRPFDLKGTDLDRNRSAEMAELP